MKSKLIGARVSPQNINMGCKKYRFKSINVFWSSWFLKDFFEIKPRRIKK